MAWSESPILLTLGLLFLLGLAADLVGRHTFVPRVTLLILVGLAVGPVGFDLLPAALVSDWFPPMTTVALSLVGFLLGEKLSITELRAHGRLVISITVAETTMALIAVALALVGHRRPPRSGAAAGGNRGGERTGGDFRRSSGMSVSKGEFPDTLLAVVALDDAVALLLFFGDAGWRPLALEGTSRLVQCAGRPQEDWQQSSCWVRRWACQWPT